MTHFSNPKVTAYWNWADIKNQQREKISVISILIKNLYLLHKLYQWFDRIIMVPSWYRLLPPLGVWRLKLYHLLAVTRWAGLIFFNNVILDDLCMRFRLLEHRQGTRQFIFKNIPLGEISLPPKSGSYFRFSGWLKSSGFSS